MQRRHRSAHLIAGSIVRQMKAAHGEILGSREEPPLGARLIRSSVVGKG